MEERVVIRIAKDTELKYSGLQLQEFGIVLNTDTLRPGDRIKPLDGDQDSLPILVVITLPETLPSLTYHYIVRLATDNEQDYVDERFLRLGTPYRVINRAIDDNWSIG
jgi:hypothetical protein